MKKSGEDRPVAPPAPIPDELVCEIADEGEFERWNAAWSELVSSVCGDAALGAMESGDSLLFDLVHAEDVADIMETFDLLRAGRRSGTTVFRIQGREQCSVEMRWSRLHDVGDGKTWLGVGKLPGTGKRAASNRAADSLDAVTHQSVSTGMTSIELAAFATAASHDLRAPLRAIHGFSEIVCEDYADAIDGTGKDYLQRIASAARRLSRTIDGVTKYLRLDGDGGSFRSVDLNDVLLEVAELHQSDNAAVSGTVSAQCLPTVHGDPIQLRLLVQELVANGLVHNQSQIPAVAVIQQIADSEHDCVVSAGRVLIVVSDNGVGVPVKDREAIFSPFRKLASGGDVSGLGLGLGLGLARRIVERHGGVLRCLEGDGGGSQFVFDLQLVPSQTA